MRGVRLRSSGAVTRFLQPISIHTFPCTITLKWAVNKILSVFTSEFSYVNAAKYTIKKEDENGKSRNGDEKNNLKKW